MKQRALLIVILLASACHPGPPVEECGPDFVAPESPGGLTVAVAAANLAEAARLSTRLGFSGPVSRFGAQILLTHYPVDPSCITGLRYALNAHGHTHGRRLGKRHLNLSVEHWKFAPVPLQTVIQAAQDANAFFDNLDQPGSQ